MTFICNPQLRYANDHVDKVDKIIISSVDKIFMVSMYNNKFKNIVRYIEIKFESFLSRYLKIWYFKKYAIYDYVKPSSSLSLSTRKLFDINLLPILWNVLYFNAWILRTVCMSTSTRRT